MSESTAFLDAVADLDYTFTTDRRAARHSFPDALALATPEDRAFLDGLVETFTLYPFPLALKRLDAQYAHEPHNQARLEKLVPDTDPGLYVRDRADRLALIEQRATRNKTTVDDEYFPLHTELAAAELPPLPMRQWRNPPARTYLAPNKNTDKSRNTAAQIRKRAAQRSKRRPAQQEPQLVADYVTEVLYTDTMAADIATAQAAEDRAIERGLVKPPTTAPAAAPRTAGAAQPIPAADARIGWNHTYVAYVAEQHQTARALAGKKPVSDDHALTAAIRRTTLHGSGDHRAAMPFQGNGLDYDQEAMTVVLGWRCVSCFVERADTDRRPTHTRDGQQRSDDGLCDYCRDDDRPGLPALPTGFTARDLATTYCRFFATTYPTAARALLAEVRRRAPRWLSNLVDEFLTDSGLPASTTAQLVESAVPSTRPQRQRGAVLGAGQHTGRCDACTRITVVAADGICSPCRAWLGVELPTPGSRAA